MWDDVIIGTGDKGNSAVLCFDLDKDERSHISENKVSYWIDNVLWGIGMTVMKDTKLGQRITQIVDHDKAPPSQKRRELKKILREAIMKNITPNKLFEAVSEFGDQRYKQGRIDKQKEIIKALNSD